ncbi:MAG: YkgJ family cysteine cluster protein [bacterium]
MKFLNYIAPIYYEFLAKFVPQKVLYKIKGECLKCGKCCRYLHCEGLGSEIEFAFLQFIYPEYRNFKIAGTDEMGNFVITCKLIDKENLCPIYHKRSSVCQKYPSFKKRPKGILHKGCGFSIHPEKSFKAFLEK